MRVPESLARWARTRELPRSGVRLFLYDTAEEGRVDGPGAKTTLLLVHGLGDEADTWQAVIPGLAHAHRVIAPDLPGFGRSPLPRRRLLSPQALAGLLLELLESAGAEDLVAVGSSLGATLVHLAATKRPSAFRGLLLVDGGFLPPSPLPPAIRTMLIPGLGERRYRSLAAHPAAAYITLVPYYASLDGLPEQMRAFLRARVAERVTSRTQGAAYLSVLRRFVLWSALRRGAAARRARVLPVPALYLWGSEDRIVPPAAGREAAARHPGSRFQTIARAGHLPHQEQPDAFVEVLTGFLASS